MGDKPRRQKRVLTYLERRESFDRQSTGRSVEDHLTYQERVRASQSRSRSAEDLPVDPYAARKHSSIDNTYTHFSVSDTPQSRRLRPLKIRDRQAQDVRRRRTTWILIILALILIALIIAVAAFSTDIANLTAAFSR